MNLEDLEDLEDDDFWRGTLVLSYCQQYIPEALLDWIESGNCFCDIA